MIVEYVAQLTEANKYFKHTFTKSTISSKSTIACTNETTKRIFTRRISIAICSKTAFISICFWKNKNRQYGLWVPYVQGLFCMTPIIFKGDICVKATRSAKNPNNFKIINTATVTPKSLTCLRETSTFSLSSNYGTRVRVHSNTLLHLY